MRFHVVINRHTGQVVKTEQVDEHTSLADLVQQCDGCKTMAPARAPVGIVSVEELDAAIEQALQSSPRWRRRRRGARSPTS